MSLCFVDTNVLIYARDPSTPKRTVARAWLQSLADERRIVLSPQVLNEFAQNVLWKLPDIPIADVVTSVELFRSWCPMAMTAETSLAALAIHRRYGYTVYDAANLAMALDAGCRYFISEDLQHRQIIAGMTIIDPFRSTLADISVSGRS